MFAEMRDMCSDAGKLYVVSIGKLLLSEWLLYDLSGFNLSLQQDMHEMHYSLCGMRQFPWSVPNLYWGVTATQLYVRDRLPTLRLHWVRQEMPAMPF